MFMQKAELHGKIVDLSKLTRIEIMRLNGKRNFFCLKCKKPLIFKNGSRKRAHFAHEKAGIATGNQESAQHILVKHAIARWLKNQGINAIVEQRFPLIDRIADVYFEHEQAKYGFEIQKSAMSDFEFKQRILDYRTVGVTVLWIFLGDVIKKANTFKIPPVMQGRRLNRYFYFCTKTARLRIFEAPVFVTTREVYAKTVNLSLKDFGVEKLLTESSGVMHFDNSWVGVKQQFRKRGWFYATKSEKKLLEQCLIRGFNLSLLPVEIGWPVVGEAWDKHLFVWQAYVLFTLMKYFRVGETFEVQTLLKLLRMEYKITKQQGILAQIVAYLKWLVMFGIVKNEQQYYRYEKAPKTDFRVEEQMKRDQVFVEIVVKLRQK